MKHTGIGLWEPVGVSKAIRSNFELFIHNKCILTERTGKVSHECDFETDDVCGWTYEPMENLEWKRVAAANAFTSFKTGPRTDHTTMTHNGGHYMLMESLIRQDMPVTLMSPIYDRELSLKTACCFQFHYYMYGAGVGTLLVVVKPLSMSLDEILLSDDEYVW